MKDEDDNVVGNGLGLVSRVTTLVDGGIRVSLDFTAADIDLVNKLINLKATQKDLFYVAFVLAEQEKIDW